jgi:dihydrofolate reductase
LFGNTNNYWQYFYKMKINLIVAASTNHAIGKNNALLWHLPNDMKFFKQTTWGMPVIMGRRTYESLQGKPLLGRLNIVITSRPKEINNNNIVVVENLNDAFFVASEHLYKQVFIIGGGEVYKQTLPKADTIYLTRVETTIEGDTFFPEINSKDFELVFEEKKMADEKHAFDYSFQTWIKK